MNNLISEFTDGQQLYLNCRACHAEAVFNARCLTPHAEQQRQVEVDRFKRDHVCGMEAAAA